MKKFITALWAVFVCIVCNNGIYAQEGSRNWKRAMESYNYVQAITALDTQIDSLVSMSASIADSVELQLHNNAIKELYLQKASCQKSIYKFSDAIESISQAIALAGEDPAAFVSLADCHRLSGNDNAAMIFYALATQLDPQNIFFKIQKATHQYKMEDFEGCISEGKNIIAQDSIPAILGLIGNCFNRLRQSDSALHYYGKVYPKNPTDYRTLEKMSSIFLSNKMYDTVVAMAQNYLSYDSSNVVINPILGLALHGKKMYKESFKVFERSLELGCDKLSGYYYQGLNTLLIEDYYDAYKWFNMAYALDSTDVNLVYNMGVCRYQTGRVKEAIELFNRAEQMLQPDSAMMYKINISRAELFFTNESFKSSVQYFVKAESYGPLHPAQLVKMGFAYRMLKDYKNALKCYDRYFKVGKEGSSSWRFAQDEVAFIKEEEFMSVPDPLL